MSKDGLTKAELIEALNQVTRQHDELARKYRELAGKYDELVGAREVDRGEDRKLVQSLNNQIETLTAAVEEMTSVAAFMSLKVQAPEQAARAFTILGIDK